MERRVDYYRQQLDSLNDIEDMSAAIARSLEIAEEARNEGEEGFVQFFEGEALCLDGDLEQGAKLMHMAVERLPNLPFILSNYAVVCSRLGRVKQALSHLNHALTIEPADLLALSQKSICLCKLYRDEEALEWFDKVLVLDPDNDHALRNKGVALSRLSRGKEAMECFEEVLRRNPDDHHAKTEKQILEDERVLLKTPLGWLILWVRKKLTPTVLRILKR